VPTEENIEGGKSVLEVDAVRDWYETWDLIYFVILCLLRWLCCFIFKIITIMFSSHSCGGKVVSMVYSKCVFVASGIQHAKCMRSIVLWSMACLAVSYFPHYLINGTIFEKMLLKIKSVFWFSLQLLSEIFLLLRRTERDIVINVQGGARNVIPLIWSLLRSNDTEISHQPSRVCTPSEFVTASLTGNVVHKWRKRKR